MCSLQIIFERFRLISNREATLIHPVCMLVKVLYLSSAHFVRMYNNKVIIITFITNFIERQWNIFFTKILSIFWRQAAMTFNFQQGFQINYILSTQIVLILEYYFSLKYLFFVSGFNIRFDLMLPQYEYYFQPSQENYWSN